MLNLMKMQVNIFQYLQKKQNIQNLTRTFIFNHIEFINYQTTGMKYNVANIVTAVYSDEQGNTRRVKYEYPSNYSYRTMCSILPMKLDDFTPDFPLENNIMLMYREN